MNKGELRMKLDNDALYKLISGYEELERNRESLKKYPDSKMFQSEDVSILSKLCFACWLLNLDDIALYDYVMMFGTKMLRKFSVEKFVDVFSGTFSKARAITEPTEAEKEILMKKSVDKFIGEIYDYWEGETANA